MCTLPSKMSARCALFSIYFLQFYFAAEALGVADYFYNVCAGEGAWELNLRRGGRHGGRIFQRLVAVLILGVDVEGKGRFIKEVECVVCLNYLRFFNRSARIQRTWTGVNKGKNYSDSNAKMRFPCVYGSH